MCLNLSAPLCVLHTDTIKRRQPRNAKIEVCSFRRRGNVRFHFRTVRGPESTYVGTGRFACHRELRSERSPAKHASQHASVDSDAAGSGTTAQRPSLFRISNISCIDFVYKFCPRVRFCYVYCVLSNLFYHVVRTVI